MSIEEDGLFHVFWVVYNRKNPAIFGRGHLFYDWIEKTTAFGCRKRVPNTKRDKCAINDAEHVVKKHVYDIFCHKNYIVSGT